MESERLKLLVPGAWVRILWAGERMFLSSGRLLRIDEVVAGAVWFRFAEDIPWFFYKPLRARAHRDQEVERLSSFADGQLRWEVVQARRRPRRRAPSLDT